MDMQMFTQSYKGRPFPIFALASRNAVLGSDYFSHLVEGKGYQAVAIGGRYKTLLMQHAHTSPISRVALAVILERPGLIKKLSNSRCGEGGNGRMAF